MGCLCRRSRLGTCRSTIEAASYELFKLGANAELRMITARLVQLALNTDSADHE
jgi:hypothetical protein